MRIKTWVNHVDLMQYAYVMFRWACLYHLKAQKCLNIMAICPKGLHILQYWMSLGPFDI